MMSKSKCRIRNTLRDECGATLALVAVGIFVLLGMVALAVDVGMLLGRRTESQRVADAAALAGAASFITDPDNADRPRTWAIEYASKNTVDQAFADVRPEDVDVLLDEFKVRVRVRNSTARGNAVQTIFARILGWDEVDVVTVAAAEAATAGSGVCPLPIALPDRWLDNPNNPDGRFDPAEDAYAPYNPPGTQCATWGQCNQTVGMSGSDFDGYAGPYTGYFGADAAHNLGDVIEVKTQSGPPNQGGGSTDPLIGDGSVEQYNASPCVDADSWRCWFLPDGSSGASSLIDWVMGCPPDADKIVIEEGDWIEPESGNVQATVIQAFKQLVDNYGGGGANDWTWTGECMADFGGKCMDQVSLEQGNEWYQRRHRAIPVIDPTTAPDNQSDAQVIRWECVFIEKVADSYYRNNGMPTENGTGPPGQWNVYVRFVPCTDGIKAGPDNGSTLKTLRLVE